jgi:hypothetical protein
VAFESVAAQHLSAYANLLVQPGFLGGGRVVWWTQMRMIVTLLDKLVAHPPTNVQGFLVQVSDLVYASPSVPVLFSTPPPVCVCG